MTENERNTANEAWAFARKLFDEVTAPNGIDSDEYYRLLCMDYEKAVEEYRTNGAH